MAARSHLSIGEVLNLVQEEFPDVTISKIRFLESQGLLDPERTPSGYRKFYDDDIERLRWILLQQRENFLPLKVIKDRLAAGELDDPIAGNGSGPAAAVPHDEPAKRPASSKRTRAKKAVAHVEEVELPLSSAGPPEPIEDPQPPAEVTSLAAQLAEITSMSLSLDELCSATGLTAAQVAELEGFGLLSGRALGGTSYYDDESMIVAKLAGRFMAHGVEPRHLRMYKIAAEREASLVEQLTLPMLQQRSPDARQRVTELVDDLLALGAELRSAMVREALREALG